VGPGATPGTLTATYTITNTTTAVSQPPVTVPDFPADKPVTIGITTIPGLSFEIKGTPANGDTVTLEPSSSVFSVMDTAVREIGGSPHSNAAAQAVGQALANIDRGLERMQAVRGFAGELLNRADRITGNQETRSTQLEGDRSRAEDLDMIKGISDFQNQQVGYEAALKSYSMVQKMSLFNFIS
jgi:flagellar hook-associated protein 3 FlgL